MLPESAAAFGLYSGSRASKPIAAARRQANNGFERARGGPEIEISRRQARIFRAQTSV